MNWFRRNLKRFGACSAATVIAMTVSTLMTQPQASAGTPECVNGVFYLAPTTLGANGGYEWVQWTNVTSETDGTFVFDQHAIGGVHTAAILPAYDSPNQLGYVTVRNLETSNETYAGWYNLISDC